MVRICMLCIIAFNQFHCDGQMIRDLIVQTITLDSSSNINHFEETGEPNEYAVFSNYAFQDSLAFDIPFSKKLFNFKPDEKLVIELWSGPNKVYSDTRNFGFFENIYLSNFPNRTDCYAIRIRLVILYSRKLMEQAFLGLGLQNL
jgi:hypothetical protein